MKRKCLAVGIILLFICVTIAPTINFNTVKASQEDDLMKAASQSYHIESEGMKRGSFTIHFYEDLDNDSVFDTDEPSPPLFLIHLKNQYPCHGLIFSRFKIIGDKGSVIFRFIPYPSIYNLTAHYERNLYGCMTEFWIYKGIINLNEEAIGTQMFLPVRHFIIPI